MLLGKIITSLETPPHFLQVIGSPRDLGDSILTLASLHFSEMGVIRIITESRSDSLPNHQKEIKHDGPCLTATRPGLRGMRL